MDLNHKSTNILVCKDFFSKYVSMYQELYQIVLKKKEMKNKRNPT